MSCQALPFNVNILLDWSCLEIMCYHALPPILFKKIESNLFEIFNPLLSGAPFFYPWKYQKVYDFLMFLGSMKINPGE